VTALVSDGEAYHPLALPEGSLTDAVRDLTDLDAAMTEKFKTSPIARTFGRRGRQFVMGMAMLGLVRRHANFREVFGGGATLKIAKILWGACAASR